MSKAAMTIQRLKSQISNYKEEFEAVGGRALNGGLTVLGGVGLGMAINKLGEDGKLTFPGTDVDVGLVGGGLGLVVGVAGLAGKYSEQLVALSSGVLGAQMAINSFRDGTPFS